MKPAPSNLIYQTTRVSIYLWFFVASNFSFALHLPSNDTLPLDPQLRAGKLSNGFSYYIRKNQNPSGKIYMYLMVKVGFLHEDEDQLELAHFLEHMAFNGTKHFPNVFDYFREKGLMMGTDVNASTDMNSTIYKLSIKNDPELITGGLKLLRDWAQDMTLDPQKIDLERGIILAEIERGSSGTFRKMDHRKWLLPNSKYGDRVSVDTRENVKHFKHQSLRRFYQDWYRPSLQAVVIVGDVDPADVVRQIELLYGDLKEPKRVREREEFHVALPGIDRYINLLDEEVKHLDIWFYRKQPGRKIIRQKDLEFSIKSDLYQEMIRERLSRLMMQYAAPFRIVQHYIRKKICGSMIDADVVLIRPNSDKDIKVSFQAVIREQERVIRYGFSPSELLAAKKKVLQTYQSGYSSDSKTLLYRYMDYFLSGEIPLSPGYELNIKQQYLQKVTIEDVVDVAREWLNEANADIIVDAPQYKKSVIPDEQTMRGWLREVKDSNIEPYVFTNALENVKKTLNEFSPRENNTSFKRNYIAGIDMTVLELSNGLQVILKPISPSVGNEKNEVLLRGFSPGGSRLYTEDKYPAAKYAAEIISNSGVCGLNKFVLEKYLTEKGLRIDPYINDDEEGIIASSKTKDVETMLKLVHQYFVNPNKDTMAFEDWRLKKFSTTGSKTVSENSLQMLAQAMSPKNSINSQDVDSEGKISLELAYNVYRERFSNASDFVFVITGDFDREEMLPIALKYLGTIPSESVKKEVYDLPPNPQLKKRKDATIYKGNANKAVIYLNYGGNYMPNSERNLAMEILGRIIESRLIERLREKEGGTYQVAVATSYSENTKGSFNFSIHFECDLSIIDRMLSASMEELKKLRHLGIETSAFKRLLVQKEQQTALQMESSGFWHEYLRNQIKHKKDINEILTYQQNLSLLTEEDIKSAARKCLKKMNLNTYMLLPESFKQKRK